MLVFLSEMLCSIFVNTVDENFLSNPNQKLVNCIMSAGTETLLMIFVLLSGIFWKRRSYLSAGVNVLLFSTPSVSLMIYMQDYP